MDAIVLFVKSFLLPGSMAFLLICLLIGVVLLFTGERGRRLGKVWLLALLTGYWLLATPAVSLGLEGRLGREYAPLASKEEARGATAIVVLSGGGASVLGTAGRIDSLSEATAIRLLEGARLYQLMDDPWIVVSGGHPGDNAEATPEALAMQRELVRLGVPAAKILIDPSSEDTHAQAQQIKPLLTAHGIQDFVLVTSGWHLPRSVGVFAHEGMAPIPSAATGHSVGAEEGDSPLLPSESSLARSLVMMREVLALVYYRLRGWT